MNLQKNNILLEKKETNLPKPSIVNVSQIVTLDKSFLVECIGTLNKQLFKQVENGIKLVLDL